MSRAAFSSGEVIKFMAPGYKMGECRDFKWVSLNRAQNSKPFTFLKLKNPSRGSKVMNGGNTTTWNGCRTKMQKNHTIFPNLMKLLQWKGITQSGIPSCPSLLSQGLASALTSHPMQPPKCGSSEIRHFGFCMHSGDRGTSKASRLFESIPIWHYLEENLLMCTKKIVFRFKMAHTYAKDELA